MKQADQYQMSREALLQEAFDLAKEGKIAREMPHKYRHDKAMELTELKRKSYERQQADYQATQEAEKAKRSELEQRLKEAEEELKKTQK